MPKKGDEFEASPYSLVEREFRRSLSGLADLVLGDVSDFHSIRMYNRGEHDILAVVKRYGPDGGIEVLFGSGSDFVGALLAAAGACRNGRWKADKPYSG